MVSFQRLLLNHWQGNIIFFSAKRRRKLKVLSSEAVTYKVVPAVNITASEAVLLINRSDHFVLKRYLIGPKDAILIFPLFFECLCPTFSFRHRNLSSSFFL